MKYFSILLICFQFDLHAITFLESFQSKQNEISQFIDLNPNSNFKQYARGKSIDHNTGQELYCWQFPHEFSEDPDLGYNHRPSSQIRHICRTNSEIAFDATYSFDQYGRRYTKIDAAEKRNQFVILSGCSYTYGSTLNDNETLNYWLGQELSQFYPYNYGIGGTGTNHTLALIQSNRFKKEVSQKDGYFFYIFIHDHIQRSNGYLPSLGWLKNSPYFEVQDTGTVVRTGSFKSGRSFYTNVLLTLNSWLPFLQGKVFPNISDEDYLYTCKLVVEAKKSFLAQFPHSQFVFLNHPQSIHLPPVLKKCLSDNDIDIIQDYTEAQDIPHKELVTPYDGHPNSKMNHIIAKSIKDYILRNKL